MLFSCAINSDAVQLTSSLCGAWWLSLVASAGVCTVSDGCASALESEGLNCQFPEASGVFGLSPFISDIVAVTHTKRHLLYRCPFPGGEGGIRTLAGTRAPLTI